jgi:hypothetical protein
VVANSGCTGWRFAEERLRRGSDSLKKAGNWLIKRGKPWRARRSASDSHLCRLLGKPAKVLDRSKATGRLAMPFLIAPERSIAELSDLWLDARREREMERER